MLRLGFAGNRGLFMSDKITDFAAILTELNEKYGITDYEMAKLTGKDRSKFTKLRTGARKQANYDDGCEIMAIYKKETGRKK